MQCDFDQVFATNTMLTKYSGIDIRRNVITDMFVRYKDLKIVAKLHSENRCYQSMDQLCQPWFKLLYDVDTNHTQGILNHCRCVRYVHWFHRNDM